MGRRISARTLMVLIMGTGFATAASADTIYVCWDGSGDYLTIQEGIDAAVDGDEVVVCDGTYTGVGNKNLDFGGKAITVRSENGPEDCIIDCEGNGRGFYFHSGETDASQLDGFTITGGNAGSGGAIYCVFNEELFLGASPAITNCVISVNAAGSGGGIHCLLSSPSMANCTIEENTAAEGGGICCFWEAHPIISDCMIRGNTASSSGGGVICDLESGPTFTNCTITENTATNGGGIRAQGTPAFAGCEISANTATSYGGGINCFRGLIVDSAITGNTAGYAGGGAYSDDGSVSLINCLVAENEAAWGAGLCSAGGALTIADCVITANSALADMGGGGGIAACHGSVVNSLITANSASYGGGICSGDGYFNISDCTITGNTAYEWPYGGGVFVWNDEGGHTTIANCVLWGNQPDAIQDWCCITVSFCDVQGSWPGSGNIDADPLFVDPNNNDYRLSPDSPCIDAADNDGLPPDTLDLDGDGDTTEPIAIDLDCRLRCTDRVDTPDTGNPDPDYPDLPIVDMGAYEYQCDGDLDGDGDIDLTDLAQLLANYGTTMTVYADGDIDLDGDVDLADLAGLLAVYGTTCE